MVPETNPGHWTSPGGKDDLSLHEQLRDTGVQERTSSREGEGVWNWEAGELSTAFVCFTVLPLV